MEHYNSINIKLDLFWNIMQNLHDYLENIKAFNKTWTFITRTLVFSSEWVFSSVPSLGSPRLREDTVWSLQEQYITFWWSGQS